MTAIPLAADGGGFNEGAESKRPPRREPSMKADHNPGEIALKKRNHSASGLRYPRNIGRHNEPIFPVHCVLIRQFSVTMNKLIFNSASTRRRSAAP
jgi:hypothetical protein